MTVNRRRTENTQRTYTADERAEAVLRVRSGQPVATISHDLDVPEKIVRRWAHRAGIQTTEVATAPAPHRPPARAPRTDDDPARRNGESKTPPSAPEPAETEPEPAISPGRSARRHWRLIAALVVVAGLAATAVGLARQPTYTAEARLVVGKTVQLSNLASIPGLAAAGQQLASDYSRLVSTGAVVNDTAKRLGQPKGDVGGTLEASPVPQSPVVRIETTASSSDRAVKIANAGSAALVNAVNTLNEKQTRAGESLLQQYRVADEQLLRDVRNLQALQQQAEDARAADVPALQEQILAAQTAVDADQVRVNALADDYRGAYSPSQLDQQVIQRVGNAASTGSDRSRVLQIYVVVAIIIALVLGTALATARDFAVARRREDRTP